MRYGRILLPVMLGMTLCLGTGLNPDAAGGFSGPVNETKSCSDCHSLEAGEAARLLKDFVREVREVSQAYVPGLFAVSVMGNDGRPGLIYVDYSGKYIISGVTVRIEDRQNISRMEMMDMNRVDTASIPLEGSLVVGDPEAPLKAFLFTDPLCPFCKKLHPELKKVVEADPGIVFFIKMLPLPGLHPDSVRISKTIMCENSLQILEDSFEGKKIPDPACESDVIDRTIELAGSLGITATPTLVLPDGRVAPGYKPADQLLSLIKEKTGEKQENR